MTAVANMQEHPELVPEHEISWMRFLRYFTALTLLVMAMLAVKKFYPPARNEHLLRMAKVFLKNSHLKEATLSLQQILVSDPNHLDATLMMAELTEATGSPRALFWRKRVVEIRPESFRYRMDWIKSALKLGEIGFAAEGLATVDEGGRRTAAFHHLAASIAIGWKQFAEAEKHAGLALQLEPENDGYKFNLALIWLAAEDMARRTKGVEIMQALTSHSEFRYRALRSLVTESAESKKLDEAIERSWELQVEPQCSLDDRIAHLDLLDEKKASKLDDFLASVMTSVESNGEATLSLALWMIQHGRARQALQWISRLPGPELVKAPIRMAHAEAYASLKDWDGLANYLNVSDWKEFEFLRRAYFARRARELKQSDAFAQEWGGAIHSASGKVGPLSMLNRLAREWNWAKESDDLLWDVAGTQANNRWALEALYEKYEKAGDSRSLYQVILRMLEVKPNDMVARNNFALLSLLLNVRVDQAHLVARELFSAYPKSPIVLSTYAYSLHVQGKSQAAVNVFKALSEEQLAQPSVAAYYGVILHGNGERDRAKKYIELGRKGSFLPEERALIDKVL